MAKRTNILRLLFSVFLFFILGSAIVRGNFLISKITGFGLFGLVAWQTIFKNCYSQKLASISLALMIIGFLLIGFFESELVRNKYLLPEPQPEKYVSDNLLYLRTYYYLKKGMKYYPAFALSYLEDARISKLPPDLWGFRLPTTIVFWWLLARFSSLHIFYLFLIFGCLILLFAFLIGQQFDQKRAIIIPYLLMPYFLYGATTIEFLQIEWWGLLPMFIFVWAVLKKKNFLLFASAFLAMITREFFWLALGPLLITAFIFEKRKLYQSLFFAFFLLLFFIFFHAWQVFQLIPFSPKMIFSGRTHNYGLEMMRQALVFGTWRYLAAPLKLFSLYLLFDLAAKLYLWLKVPQKRFLLVFLTCLYLPLLASFLKMGHCCWSDYWGVALGPFLLLSLGLTLLIFRSVLWKRN